MNKGISKTIVFDNNLTETDYDKHLKDDEFIIQSDQTNQQLDFDQKLLLSYRTTRQSFYNDKFQEGNSKLKRVASCVSRQQQDKEFLNSMQHKIQIAYGCITRIKKEFNNPIDGWTDQQKIRQNLKHQAYEPEFTQQEIQQMNIYQDQEHDAQLNIPKDKKSVYLNRTQRKDVYSNFQQKDFGYQTITSKLYKQNEIDQKKRLKTMYEIPRENIARRGVGQDGLKNFNQNHQIKLLKAQQFSKQIEMKQRIQKLEIQKNKLKEQYNKNQIFSDEINQIRVNNVHIVHMQQLLQSDKKKKLLQNSKMNFMSYNTKWQAQKENNNQSNKKYEELNQKVLDCFQTKEVKIKTHNQLNHHLNIYDTEKNKNLQQQKFTNYKLDKDLKKLLSNQ